MAEKRTFYQPILFNETVTFGSTATATAMALTSPTISGKPKLSPTVTTYTGATDAIDISLGDHFVLNRSGAVDAATLAAPAAGDAGRTIWITNGTTQANTITVAGGLGGSGASHDVITFGAVVAANVTLRAYALNWYLVGSYSATVA